ncbi:PREDICTED: CMRF35-like molecule 8 isoform X2 [Propithecus coquereli]|uniref:CMRF35-like molecule 8 isoform X2 n=1 Tax=Propithecus coquereli TaxID=379532 RepID=UPI00063F29F7|nr:PREDICTED: CMRF35-like molecule 8 isoform X2 [Propithecus coquereli]
MWLPSALLLLWVPGCFSLGGSNTVTGSVGGSLSVQCPYKEEYRTAKKYWCKGRFAVLCDKIVETKDSEREARTSRVSITDHPENLNFTVTMRSLTVEDTGTYWCGVDKQFLDVTSEFEVTVSPASTPVVPTTITIVTTLTVTTEVPTVPSTALSAVSATCSASIQDEPQKSFGPRLSLLLSLLAFLLLLLVGISLLAWRMFQKQVKAGEPPALSQGPRQAAEQSEQHYVNLELLTRPLREEPVPARQVEVEYSTLNISLRGAQRHLGESSEHYTSWELILSLGEWTRLEQP